MQLFINQPYVTDSSTLVVTVDSPEKLTIAGLKAIITGKDSSIPPDIGIRTLTSSQLDEQCFLSEYNIHDLQTLQIVPQFQSRCVTCSEHGLQ